MLELDPGEADFGLHVREPDGDRDVGVRRERLLGFDAVLAQPGDRGDGRGVVVVEAGRRGADGGEHVLEHRFVEVDATQPLDPPWRPEELEAGLGLVQHRGVERAAAEVEHGDHGPGFHAGLGGVVDGGRLRLAQDRHVVEVGPLDGLAEQVELERPPVRGMGDRDAVRRTAFDRGDGVDHPAQ